MLVGMTLSHCRTIIVTYHDTGNSQLLIVLISKVLISKTQIFHAKLCLIFNVNSLLCFMKVYTRNVRWKFEIFTPSRSANGVRSLQMAGDVTLPLCDHTQPAPVTEVPLCSTEGVSVGKPSGTCSSHWLQGTWHDRRAHVKDSTASGHLLNIGTGSSEETQQEAGSPLYTLVKQCTWEGKL